MKILKIIVTILVLIVSIFAIYFYLVKDDRIIAKGKYDDIQIVDTKTFIKKAYYIEVGDRLNIMIKCFANQPLWHKGVMSSSTVPRAIVCSNGTASAEKSEDAYFYGFGWERNDDNLLNLTLSLSNMILKSLSKPEDPLKGLYECKEDLAQRIKSGLKDGVRIYDCKIYNLSYDIGKSEVFYSIAIYPPARDEEVRNFFIVSDFANNTPNDASVELRDHAKEIKPLSSTKSISNVTIWPFQTTYAGGGGGGGGGGDGTAGDSADSGVSSSCSADGTASCSAPDGDYGGGLDVPAVCPNGATDFPVCTPPPTDPCISIYTQLQNDSNSRTSQERNLGIFNRAWTYLRNNITATVCGTVVASEVYFHGEGQTPQWSTYDHYPTINQNSGGTGSGSSNTINPTTPTDPYPSGGGGGGGGGGGSNYKINMQ